MLKKIIFVIFVLKITAVLGHFIGKWALALPISLGVGWFLYDYLKTLARISEMKEKQRKELIRQIAEIQKGNVSQEKAEKVFEAIYELSFEEGYSRGYTSGRASGHSEGFAAGRASC